MDISLSTTNINMVSFSGIDYRTSHI